MINVIVNIHYNINVHDVAELTKCCGKLIVLLCIIEWWLSERLHRVTSYLPECSIFSVRKLINLSCISERLLSKGSDRARPFEFVFIFVFICSCEKCVDIYVKYA